MSRKILFIGLFILLGLLSAATPSGFAQNTGAQANALQFDNNFFVTGDYAVGGVSLIGQANKIYPGYAVGTISMGADTNPGVKGANNSVPAGAEIVAALVYWQTIELIGGATGQNGFFRPVFSGGPATGYAMQGTPLKNPNGTVYWNGSGCTSGSSTPKQLVTYLAVVTPYLRQDAQGNVLAGNTTTPQNYEVRLPSQSNGSPLTLGATLVLIYRVMSPNFPLNSIVIYDGSFSPSSSLLTTTNTIQGFYQSDGTKSKLTYIVGNGQKNQSETVTLNGSSSLPSFYGASQPPFPGWYSGGEWDTVTWTFPNASVTPNNPVPAGSSSLTLSWPSQSVNTVLTSAKAECVTPAAVIFSTRVSDPDHDGLPPVLKNSRGYCDPAINNGSCNFGSATDPGYVPLDDPTDPPQVGTAAHPRKDVFVQLDYMVDASNNPLLSYSPANDSATPPQPIASSGGNVNLGVTRLKNALLGYAENFGTNNSHKVHLHVFAGNALQNYSGAITEQTCTDFVSVPGQLCSFPSPPDDMGGYVGWKGNFTDIKNQLVLNGDPTQCTSTSPPAGCQPRFQHGRKDSYHYVMLGRAPGLTEWFMQGGTLKNVQQTGNVVTFTTSTSHGPLNAVGIVYPTSGGGLTTIDPTTGLPTGLTPPTDPNCSNGRVTIVGAITNPNLNGTFCIQNFTDTTFTVNIGGSAANTRYTLATDPDIEVAPGYVTTTSGVSDEGGEDSLITLASWGPRATEKVIGGTIMHETGHSNALTHGGFFFPNAASSDYRPAVETNCKPDFQSVMSYTRQFDLLQFLKGYDASNNPVLLDVVDYSGEPLRNLVESTAGTAPVFPSFPFYFYTSWYGPTSVVGGSAALAHCDGTPITDGASYNLVVGPAIKPAAPLCPLCNAALNWSVNQDINFNGNYNDTLLGYNDWANINFDQVGATGSLSSTGGGLAGHGGGLAGHGGGLAVQGGGLAGHGGGLAGHGGGLAGHGGGLAGHGDSEPSLYTGDSAGVHPPTQLFATEGVSPRTVTLTWTKPTGIIVVDRYNIYRTPPGSPLTVPVSSLTCTETQCTYVDTTATCNPAGYTYAVSALQQGTSNESTKSNSVNTTTAGALLTGCYTNSAPATPPSVTPVFLNDLSFTPSPAVQGSSVAITWSLRDDDTGAYVTTLAANTLFVTGPVSANNCNTTTQTRIPLLVKGTPQNGLDSFTSSGNQFIFRWNNTDAFCAGSFTFELDTDSQQSETSSPLQLQIDVNDSDTNPHVTTASVPDATVDLAYNFTFTEDGGTAAFTWALAAGSGPLPSGITLNSSTGKLSGTPTVPASAAVNFIAQVYPFTVQVTDSLGNVGTQASTLRLDTAVSLNRTDYATGNKPYAVVSADFNGDGKPDLAIANRTDNTVSILLGNGDGTFTAQPNPLATGNLPYSMAVGDFNHDGLPDLVVTNFNDGTVSVFLGTGGGTFSGPVTYNIGAGLGPESVVTGDFNGDTFLDLAVANQNNHTVSILVGNGDGSFQPAMSYPAGTTDVAGLATGDFNGDSKLDLAVANPSSDTVSVLLGNGDGTFAAPVPYVTGTSGDHPVAVTALYVNGDSKLDLAVTNLNAKTVAILLGNGDGTFQSRVSYPTTNGIFIGPSAITTGDFNGDGIVDLAITDQEDNTVSILLGNGDGSLQKPLEFATGNFAGGIAVADFNGDGRLDLAVANNTDGTVSVFLHLPQPPTNLAAATTTQVTLTWTTSTSTNVTAYNVYRATTSGGYTTPLITLNSTAASFTDTTVVHGTTYYYVVTVVDANHLESVKSNEVSAMP